jgi:hypothetical protein
MSNKESNRPQAWKKGMELREKKRREKKKMKKTKKLKKLSRAEAKQEQDSRCMVATRPLK